MPLRFDPIHIPFGAGVDTRRHPHLVDAPQVAVLQNYRLTQPGAYVPRPDYVGRGTVGLSTNTVRRLAEWNGTLVALSDDGAYQWRDTDGSNWRVLQTKGPRAIDVRRRPIVRSEEGCAMAVSAANNGYVAHVWSRCITGDTQVWLRVDDADTGATVYGPAVVPGLACAPPLATSQTDVTAQAAGLQIVAFETSYFAIFCEASAGSAMAGVLVTTSASTVSVGAATSYTSTAPATFRADARQNNANIYAVATVSGTPSLIRFVRSGSLIVLHSSATLTGLTGDADLALHNDVQTQVLILGEDASGNIVSGSVAADAALSGSIALTALYTVASTDPGYKRRREVTGCVRADGSMVIAYTGFQIVPKTTTGADGMAVGIKWLELSSAFLLLGGSGRVVWNARLQGWPFADGSSVFIPTAAPAPDPGSFDRAIAPGGLDGTASPQPYWSSRQEAALLEVAGPSDAVGNRACVYQLDVARRPAGPLPHVYRRTASDGSWFLGVETDEILVSSATGLARGLSSALGQSGLHSAALTVFTPGGHIGIGYANEVMITGAGYLAQVDGERHAEVMQLPPPAITEYPRVNPSIIGGMTSGVDLGSYQTRFCWVWRDAHGNVHRSAPSEAITANIGLTDQQVPAFRVAVPAFADARSDGALPTDLRLEAYVSPAASVSGIYTPDGVFVRRAIGTSATTPAPFTLDDGESSKALEGIIDTAGTEAFHTVPLFVTPDNGIGSFELNGLPLYVSYDSDDAPQVLEHDPTPCPLHVASSRDRVWLIDSENRDTAWYSAPIQPGQAPTFSFASTLRVPGDAGDLTAIGVLDDLVVFFGESSIHAVETTEGPDRTGTGAFPPLRRISREVGCIEAASVLTTDAGLMFRSRAGIYIMRPGGVLEYVGRDVEDFVTDATVIVAASVVPQQRQAIFDTATGGALIYDYELGAWSTYVYDGGLSVPSIVAAAAFEGTHVICTDQSAVLQQEESRTTSMSTQLVTSWIKLAGLQGFKRIRSVGILGRIEDGGDDILGTLTMRCWYDYSLAASRDYVINVADLSDRDPMHLRWHLKDQKCAAIKIGILYTPPSLQGEPPPGFTVGQARVELTGLALEVGTKRGLRKIGRAGGVGT